MIDTIVTDLRYALRQLRRTPGFTIVAVLTLALGIGANTTVFSLLNAALFREVKAPEPTRLVWLVGTQDDRSRFRNLSYPEYLEHRAHDSAFTGLMTYNDVSLALGSGGEPARVSGLIVTGNYFQVLGLKMQLGRGFLPDEDSVPGLHPVAIVGDALWRSRFGADSNLVGNRITINGKPFTVVGIAPRGFTGIDLGQPGELFVPIAMIQQAWPGNERMLQMRDARWLRVVGRLKPGVALASARARAAVVGRQLAAAWPREMEHTSASVQPLAGGLDPNNRQEGLPIFMLLMAVPAMVLLIACANAANLLLSRAASRRREIGVRLALGASRGRIVRMLVTESLLLGVAAGAVGMLASLWLSDVIAVLGEVPSYITDVMSPDGRVLAFTMTLGILTGLIFGLVPALGATRPDVVGSLKEDGIAGARVSRSRLRSAFVIAQVSVSLVLLITAGLFLRTLAKATKVQAGFDPKQGMAVSFDLATMGYDAPRQQVFYQDVLERVSALPGVTSASLASQLPLSGRMYWGQVLKQGDDGASAYQTSMTSVWPGFFKTMGTALVAGRDFTNRDDAAAPGVVIINERLASRLWPGQSPLGKRLRFADKNDPLLEVVGVARDGKYDELTEDPVSYVYLPQRQQLGFGSDMTLIARTSGDPSALLPTVRSVIRQMDHNLPIYNLRTLEEHVRLRLDKQRGASALLGAFGGLALLLAALGLYGVMAYAVAQRTREIGIRMALGAERRGVLTMVVGEGVKLAAIGIVVGLALAAALTRVIAKFLYGVTATDVVTFVAVSLLLAGVAAAASLIPARRATLVDPVVALRAD